MEIPSRDIGFYGTRPTAGTNNAILADNITFSGNYGLNLSTTSPNFLGGSTTIGTVGLGQTHPVNGYADASGTLSGIKVETSRSSPSTSDTQNVYSGSYTPTYTRTGATFVVQPHYWTRVGNLVTVIGYTDETVTSASGDITISLPITPTAFSSNATNAARGQAEGTCHLDTTTIVAGIIGTYSGTTVSIDGSAVGTANAGLRVHFTYRLN